MSSRILWLMLLMITLLLAALAPLGYREEVTWRLGEEDVQEWPELMLLVREAGEAASPSPSRRIWELMEPELQIRLAQTRIPGHDQDAANPFDFLATFRAFQRDLNRIVAEEELYEPASFAEVRLLSPELRALRELPFADLDAIEKARFNRLLLEAAFPDRVRISPPTSVQLTYGWADFGSAYPLRGVTLRESLQSSASWLMYWFVGVVGVFVAVLITASIVPQMFDAGSLHLLLSKPVSRSLLFLAKYLGGCAFIVIGASYLIGGLWLILGLRFSVWEPKLLLSIPIYLFVFAIYYSVSALAGVIWRSAIVSIAITVLFWLACFLIGTAKNTFEGTIWDKARLVRLLEAEDDLLAVNELGVVQQWDDGPPEWTEVFVTPEQRQARAVMMFMPSIPREMLPLGPVYDPQQQRLLSIQPTFPPGGMKLYVGTRESNWEPVSKLSAPLSSVALFRESNGQLLAVSSMGLFRLTRDPLQPVEPLKLFGFEIPLELGGPFQNVNPDPPVLLTSPASAAFDVQSGSLALYTRGTLSTLEVDAETGRYRRRKEVRLDGEEREPVVLAIGGQHLLVGREDGRLQTFDARTLALLNEVRLEEHNQPRFIAASPSGRQFAAVFHNGRLWQLDTAARRWKLVEVPAQGQVSAAVFSGDQQLLIAHNNAEVTRFAIPQQLVVRRYRPRLGLMGVAYRYGLLPLYTVFPKPGELDETAEYMLSGRETERLDRDSLTAAQRAVDPWAPVWSSALFTAVVLAVACLYIERQDF